MPLRGLQLWIVYATTLSLSDKHKIGVALNHKALEKRSRTLQGMTMDCLRSSRPLRTPLDPLTPPFSGRARRDASALSSGPATTHAAGVMGTNSPWQKGGDRGRCFWRSGGYIAHFWQGAGWLPSMNETAGAQWWNTIENQVQVH